MLVCITLSILRYCVAIRTVIQAGHKYDKMVGMCGEFASDEKAVPILLGMGLNEFSMAASEIASTRYQIRHLNYEHCQALADEICQKINHCRSS